MSSRWPDTAEWLEADGLGGFASGTVGGARTRRYHALLLASTTPPAGRVVLVNGLEVWVETPAGTFALSSQRYVADVTHPDGARRIESFDPEPWPRWVYRLDSGTLLEHELFVPHESAACVLRWRISTAFAGKSARLFVRPLLSGRDYHSTHHENGAFRFDAAHCGELVMWRAYDGLPRVVAATNGTYEQRPEWYRNFQYDEERARGLDYREDLASPGVFEWDLSKEEAALVLVADGLGTSVLRDGETAIACAKRLEAAELRRRKRFVAPLERAADQYVVRRGTGKTIVAGYPWFTDWGRDTFIAVRGLCIAGGRLTDARDILLEWSGAVSQGMLPNRFPDAGTEPEFNAVDASLWYVVAVHDLVAESEKRGRALPARHTRALVAAVKAILDGYARGTRFGIRCDDDGLLACGQPGVQLTWMDAKIGDWVVTRRTGKPVEVQALWINALRAGALLAPDSARWSELAERATRSFEERFWNEERGCLYDVVDVDHVAGVVDPTLRPNQIFAVGGLPFALLSGERARRVVDAVESSLLTPLGLRSLAPGEHGYTARYEGDSLRRDSAYHQGTVWPWLLGPFIDACLRVRGSSDSDKRAAHERFLEPMLRHLDEAGIGHVSEIVDAETPHAPRGCPFQAWSIGELMRVSRSCSQTKK